MNKRVIFIALFCAAAFVLAGAAAAQTPALTPMEELGKMLYFDANLSSPTGQSCATCHAPAAGYVGGDSSINAGGAVYPGAIPTRFGNRKPPSAAYAFGPNLHFDMDEMVWVGGTFWDGRATGWALSDPLAEQAMGPYLNPLEHNMSGPMDVCLAVAASTYAGLFEQVWGIGSLDCVFEVSATYERIGRSVSAYERSAEVNPFTSKYDYYLAGEAGLTGLEKQGLKLFEGEAMCSACHISQAGLSGEPPMFTDFTYDNIGSPRNPANPFYTMPPVFNPDGAAWVDEGLGGFLKALVYPESIYLPEMGKMKVPTLRNVALVPEKGAVKAYGHNGYFKSLQSVVHFYNTRDVLPQCDTLNDPKEGANCWPAPELAMNINTTELGDLGLKPHEEEAIVEFLKTLTDGYKP